MIGIDIVKIDRIEKIYEKFKGKFLNKVFNEEEISYIKNKKFKLETIAGMYASKEAVSKAMSTGIGKISFKDIKIIHKNKSPYAYCKNFIFKLSISHDGGFAISLAVRIDNNCKNLDIDKSILKDFPKRKDDSNKSDMGKIAIVAGSRGMTGAAYLSSNAALKSGSGLVYNIVPENIFNIMSIKHTEVIVKSYDSSKMKEFLGKMDAIAIGPGLSQSEEAKRIFKMVMSLDKKLVIDADGLNILARDLKILKGGEVLTPHLGEFSRLTKLSIDEIKKNKIDIAKNFARENKVTLLLKGKNTIVTNGIDLYINKSGNSSMAKAGSGDVLTGIIASLLGRNLDGFTSAKLGAYIHGLSGDYARCYLSSDTVLASDLIKYLSKVLKNIDILREYKL